MTLTIENNGQYIFGSTELEQKRLLRQALEYEPQSSWLLDQLGMQPGWHVVDFGCGPIGILNLLAERVGNSGSVIGIERERRFVDAARTELAVRNLRNVQIKQVNALSSGLDRGAFDLVHERLLLVNIQERATLINEMVSLLRPGGVIALEDVDDITYTCSPMHPSWTVLFDTFQRAFHADGGKAHIGRELCGYLYDAGVRNIKVKVHVDVISPEDPRRTTLLSLIDSLRDKIIDQEILTEDELERHRKAVTSHLMEPTTVLIDKLFVQAWGHR
jgi:SAM-dependent methyltransferase